MSEHENTPALINAENVAAALTGMVGGYRREGVDYNPEPLIGALIEGMTGEQAARTLVALAGSAVGLLAATAWTPSEGDL